MSRDEKYPYPERKIQRASSVDSGGRCSSGVKLAEFIIYIDICFFLQKKIRISCYQLLSFEIYLPIDSSHPPLSPLFILSVLFESSHLASRKVM
jgi:hypothetical protein